MITRPPVTPISRYVNTSADDCKINLGYARTDDLPTLREALKACEKTSYSKTKCKYIAARIKQLEREVA